MAQEAALHGFQQLDLHLLFTSQSKRAWFQGVLLSGQVVMTSALMPTYQAAKTYGGLPAVPHNCTHLTC